MSAPMGRAPRAARPTAHPSLVELHIVMHGRHALLADTGDAAVCACCDRPITSGMFPIVAAIIQLRGDRTPPHSIPLCRPCAPTARDARRLALRLAGLRWPALPAVLADEQPA